MRVSCPDCGAEYQFDSSAIPAKGYDAQCTNCSSVFFVEPEPTGQQPIPDPNRIVTVGCPNCDSQYQFPAKDIPAGGYDAQCTQCNEVFFVSDELEGAENRVIGSPEPSTLTAEALADYPLDADIPEDPEQKTLKVRLRDDERAALEDTAPIEPRDSHDIESIPEADANLLEDIPAMEAEPIGVPEPPPPETVAVQEPMRRMTAPMSPIMPEPLDPAGPMDPITEPMLGEIPDIDDDLGEQFQSGKRRAVMLGGAILAAALLAAVLWSSFGIDPAQSEEFLARVDRGRDALRLDTDAGYQAAVSELRFALEIAPDNPQAQALLGMAKVMRGANVEERGRFLVERGRSLRRELESVAAERSDEAQSLRDQIEQLSKESSALMETGRKDINEGFSALNDALGAAPDDPTVLDAAAVYYSISDEALRQSRDMATKSLERRGLSVDAVDWKKPPSPWVALALGRAHAGLDESPGQARAILDGLLITHADLHRARFALARIALKQDEVETARQRIEEVFSISPEHERAKLWMGHLDALAASAAATAAVAGVEPAPSPEENADGAVDGTADQVESDPSETVAATEKKVESAKKKKKRRSKRGRKKRKRKKR